MAISYIILNKKLILGKLFLTEKERALRKLQKYCAYQDRCHKEVRSKLLDLQIYGADLEDIIVDLIEDNFLNEERFAKSYARGKFRMKQWGRVKIKQELKFRKISAYCLKKAMLEIEEEEYINTLTHLIEKKKKQYEQKEKDLFKLKGKIATYIIGRGFESTLVWHWVNELLPRPK